MANEYVRVTDLDCVVGCRRLVQSEANLAGGSWGQCLWAVEQAKERAHRDATSVLIFHDRGERYVDTIYSDEWVEEHLGNIAHFCHCAGISNVSVFKLSPQGFTVLQGLHRLLELVDLAEDRICGLTTSSWPPARVARSEAAPNTFEII